ncbi:MAG TPA: DUF3090 domain-containing protein [Actinomycetota bacterium]|nr:DUF3090 domain-containing protein [Actinomycetota bacterium]
MDDIEFDGVDRITVGAIGPPGRRTFYLQARQGPEQVTLVVEKDHVIALGEGTEEIFKAEGYPKEPIEWDADSMALEQPVTPEFRVGTIAIGYAEDRDLVLIECRALTGNPGDEPAEPEPGDEPPAAEEDAIGPAARFWITRAQLQALAAHGMTVAAQGRPLCPLCRVPMDPEGHVCYASNGHRTEV